ncbi:MAG TPA: hypothetical protein DDZ51_13220 [Planctomycetaceae bacterium]|nr:hypothetical protein [Planctomycetaceae bacterium]
MMKPLPFLSIMMLVVVASTGCGNPSQDGDYEKVEHFVPAHWPNDLLDASAKIEERTSQLKGQPATDAKAIEDQLRDIVGWVPEIAADTDLTEQQWNPIYFASEKLSKRLAKMPRPLDDATLGAIEDYRKLLSETAKLLPPEEVAEVDPDEVPDETSVEKTSQPVAAPLENASEDS